MAGRLMNNSVPVVRMWKKGSSVEFIHGQMGFLPLGAQIPLRLLH